MVYFVTDEQDRIKIGHARNVKARLRGLQAGNAERLTLIGTRHGGRAEEQQFHREFARDHIRGEWFRFSFEILDAAKDPETVRRERDEWERAVKQTQRDIAEGRFVCPF